MKSFARKWRSLEVGPYRLHLYQLRDRHAGTGYKLGCGHDILEVCHSLTKDGVEVWKRTVEYRVTFQ